jgi:anti-sigma regulatory factor (Ser/Thr protein kinase)
MLAPVNGGSAFPIQGKAQRMADETSPDGQPSQLSTQRVETSAMYPADISRARRIVIQQLGRWRCVDTDDAALVLSELITNAVVHAAGAVHIAVSRNGANIRIEVHDAQSRPPERRAPGAAPGGRGLHIVDQLSEQWGSQPTLTGKVVWAVLPCAAGSQGRQAADGP